MCWYRKEKEHEISSLIPAAVAKELSDRFDVWVAERVDPFGEPIAYTLESIAREKGAVVRNEGDLRKLWDS